MSVVKNRVSLENQKRRDRAWEYRWEGSPMEAAYPLTQTMRETSHTTAAKKVVTGNSNPEIKTVIKYPGKVSRICWWDRWTQLKALTCLLVPSVGCIVVFGLNW